MFIFGILRKYLIIAGVLGAVGFGLWKYYTHTQETIRVHQIEPILWPYDLVYVV